jgi:hypothetical protein
LNHKKATNFHQLQISFIKQKQTRHSNYKTILNKKTQNQDEAHTIQKKKKNWFKVDTERQLNQAHK